uniref:Enoyl-CoA hydratase n=1 Tax=Aureoumbra lagunensis TaxID=44058 RepID=A0A7S3JT27_9STRA
MKQKKQVDKNTRGKYAAPYAIIDCIGYGLSCGDNATKAFEHEAQAFVKLAKTDTSTALIGLFDGITATKKNRFASSTQTEKKQHNVCVLGAGLMGAGIAQVSAERGMNVVLKDRDAKGVAKGIKYIGDNLDKKVKKRRLSVYERNLTIARVQGYDENMLSGYERKVKNTHVVIEAVFENLQLKHDVLSQVEKLVSNNCIIATNTSALPITNVAQGLKKKDRVLGMHYFSPVPQMQLLEIIPHAETCDDALRIAFQVGIDQGKTCILVKDVPGFYVNRALAPQMAEIGPLFADGVDPAKLDAAILDLGMPVGPITLLDEVGADVALHVQNTMIADPTMENRMDGADPTMLQKIVDNGWLGRKSGKGFFLYNTKGKSKKKEPNQKALDFVQNELKQRDLDIPLLDIQDRYLARFVNEAAVCLQEGIIDSPQDADLAAVFGVGFLPFTGGPFRMLDARGTASYVDRMHFLADTYGSRFSPCQLLLDYAKSGSKFYPLS